jgi:chemosensory pili system protein ChpA (sensor histidine kinase/response regulator)
VSIHVPISARVSDVLLVRSGAHELAIPVAVIQQVLQRTVEAMAVIRGKAEVSWLAEPYPYRHLTTLLDPQAETVDGKRAVPLVLLRSGGQRLAVEVDEIVGTRRIVVKQLGRQLASIGGLLGATVLASGDIVLVIDPVQMRDAREQFDGAATKALRNVPEAVLPQAPSFTAMVVDDSVTVRKVVERVLTREGYRVVLARDGIDALERLREAVPDIMLVDIEMPRMDGYDLVKTVRADPATRQIPVIMISSRAADKHRNHALSLGVDVYLGKPFQEDVLFEHMRTLLAARSPALAAATA